MLLSRFPRLQLAHRNTPLEYLPRLSDHLGGPRIYIKRDDCTGLGGGGNKIRKLEFLMAEALQQDADTIITCGAVQSNHARQTAAVAAKLGVKCELVLQNCMDDASSDYLESGNRFLDHLFGAKIHPCLSSTDDLNVAMKELAQEVRSRGGHPYIIPTGGSNPVGSLGYVDCALEIIEQANEQALKIDHFVHATGSAGTQAGLVTGFKATGANIPVLGIGVSAPRSILEDYVYQMAEQTATLVGVEGAVKRDDIVVNCDYLGEGYGIPTDSMKRALQLMASREGLLLDPVYSGKGMAGLIDLIQKGYFKKDDNIVFLHTGGSAALFGYYKQLL
jgi:L-cysteate sulfo-lyase